MNPQTDEQKQKSLIEGKVAGVLSERELFINIGEAAGVKIGMKFKILANRPIDVQDPETNEILGNIDREKVRVKVVEIQEKFAVCKTYKTKYVRGGPFSADLIFSLTEPSKTVFETLKADDSALPSPLSEDESFVKRGDRAIQLLNDDD